jgi:hypothetical protein
MKKDLKFSHGRNGNRGLKGNIRIFIFIFFILICIIIAIYNTYFESNDQDKSNVDDDLPRIANVLIHDLLENKSFVQNSSLNESILKNISTIQIHSPSITESDVGDSYISFIMEIENESSIWFTKTSDDIFWAKPWLGLNDFTNLTDLNDLNLEFSNSNNFRLFYEKNGFQFLSISNDAVSWSPSEPWNYQIEDRSISITENEIFSANHTGLWVSDFKDQITWHQLFSQNFSNASILNLDDEKLLIVHENATNSSTTLTITTIELRSPTIKDLEPRWDLLIIFIILGLILLYIMIQEVAHK